MAKLSRSGVIYSMRRPWLAQAERGFGRHYNSKREMGNQTHPLRPPLTIVFSGYRNLRRRRER